MKKESVAKLKKKADKVFSTWIRNRDKGQCFTCIKKDDPKYMQAGHYFSRSYTNLRYDEVNVNCQCVGCNVFKSGNIPVYKMRICVKYGNQELDRLEKNYKKEKRFTIADLKQIIQKYDKSTSNNSIS